MAVNRQSPDQRRYFRASVDLPATLFLSASDDMRRTCRIFNLSGSGLALRVASLEPISADATHEIRFELPNRSEALYFECQVVYVTEDEGAGTQDLRLRFIDPRPGNQDAVISYLQNRKRFDRSAFKVAMPVSMEAQTGIRQFVPYRGTTVEVGKEYALCEMASFGLAVTSEVVATFLAPGYRDEIFLQAGVTKVERTGFGSYRVRILFQAPSDPMLDFIRRHYAAKAKAIQSTG
ncbi:MAG: PilZ domain-containing protein [Chloroflexota bacterium]